MRVNNGMKFEKELPKRKKIRLEDRDYSACGVYFITICTLDRRNYFWRNIPVGAIIDRPQCIDYTLSSCGEIVNEAIKKIPIAYPRLSVDSYVIMPNHIHLMLRICGNTCEQPTVTPAIPRVIKQMKGYVSKRVGTTIWQKSFHDHIIRNHEDYEKHLKYIHDNPIHWDTDIL